MAAKKPPAKRQRNRAAKTPIEILNDTKNLEILEYARRHAQSTVGDIGKGVGLERDAAQKRINKLTDLGALQRRYDVNLDDLGFENRYLMDITVDHKELKVAHGQALKARGRKRTTITNPQEWLAMEILKLNDKAENKNVIIEDIAVMMGDPADLCATVRTRGLQRVIFDFVTARVRPIPGIQSSSTCIEAWSASRDHANKQTKLAKLRAANKKKKSTRKKRGDVAAVAAE